MNGLLRCCARQHTASPINARIAASSACLLSSANPSESLSRTSQTFPNPPFARHNERAHSLLCSQTHCFANQRPHRVFIGVSVGFSEPFVSPP
ncbi:hypothetical protein CDAR_502271 [Caerostris darwini]|uniref:Uncharacterized protein n=1 Tax=Caerostris darwini TaxID=1538125 RepID=A0AAV4R569_9ARAC|nr:hypothetical protein CDAR_502271 [Caerostris darwini]